MMRILVRTIGAALWVAAVALLLTSCPGFTPVAVRTPIDAALRTRAVAVVEQAWREAGLPAVSLAGVAVERADTCESYHSLCWPFYATRCPDSAGGVGISVECAPDDEHVIVAPSAAMTSALAVHGLIHIASALADLNRGPGDDRGADLHHADRRLWSQHGSTTVEARTLRAMSSPTQPAQVR